MSSAPRVYPYRLAYYYQAIAIYMVTLVAYALFVGTISGNRISVVFDDPVFYLLALVSLWSILALMVNWFSARRVVITDEAIVFKSRLRERSIPLTDVLWIRIGREKRVKVRGAYRVAKIKLRGRRRLVRLRPGNYEPEHGLIQDLHDLASRIAARGK
jgi:hypothetical protein